MGDEALGGDQLALNQLNYMGSCCVDKAAAGLSPNEGEKERERTDMLSIRKSLSNVPMGIHTMPVG